METKPKFVRKRMNGRKKSGFSREKHFKTGRDLFAIRKAIQKLEGDICEAYPVNSIAAKSCEKIIKNIDKLRCDLDNFICREHPLTDTRVIEAYYWSLEYRSDVSFGNTNIVSIRNAGKLKNGIPKNA